VRPWLIPNCDPSYGWASGCLLALGSGIENPGCYHSDPNGVVGQTIQIAIQTKQKQFGAVDDGPGFTGYQQSVVTCNTGLKTCGSIVTTLPGSEIAFPSPEVTTLLHVPAGSIGTGQGQDRIDVGVCPPQIHAGSRNPLVMHDLVGADGLIATSDSIVTAYLYNQKASQPDPNVVKSVTVLGFAQIFVTQQDPSGDIEAVILGVVGCSTTDTDCDSGALKGSTLVPIRLITFGGG